MKRLQRRKPDCLTGPCLAKPFPIAHPNYPNCTATSGMQLTGQLLQGQPPLVPPNSAINPLSAFHKHLTTSAVTPGVGVIPPMPRLCTVQPQAQTRSMPYRQMPPIPALVLPNALASQSPSPAGCSFCNWFKLLDIKTADPLRTDQHAVEMAKAVQAQLIS